MYRILLTRPVVKILIFYYWDNLNKNIEKNITPMINNIGLEKARAETIMKVKALATAAEISILAEEIQSIETSHCFFMKRKPIIKPIILVILLYKRDTKPEKLIADSEIKR